MNTLFCLFAILVAQAPPDFRDRERHPLAPSLPLLTKEEERKIEAIIDRFIQADIGKLKGEAAKKAFDDFDRLGPEATVHLIDAFNRAANMESSCPAVIIAKKLHRFLGTSNDVDLLSFAKDNLGADVTAKRHLNVLKDLQFQILARKSTLQARAAQIEKAYRAMSLADLETSVRKERGASLKAALKEAEKRDGPKAVDILVMGIQSSEPEIAKWSAGLLEKNLKHQNAAVLKSMLQHDAKAVRIASAQAIGARKLRHSPELIALLQDGDDEVRQAGRRALMQISGVDHGPSRNASFDERELAITRWREWLSKQK